MYLSGDPLQNLQNSTGVVMTPRACPFFVEPLNMAVHPNICSGDDFGPCSMMSCLESLQEPKDRHCIGGNIGTVVYPQIMENQMEKQVKWKLGL